MQYSQPIACFLTFTTYGTWLHGDERGSVNRHGKTLASHYLGPAPGLEALRRSQLADEPLLLDAAMRDAVQRAIEAHCRIRDWKLLALAVRTNHVHAAIAAQAATARVLNEIKAYATRALRDAGLVGAQRRVWTRGGRGGSQRKCFTAEDVAAVCRYIREGQGPELPRLE